MNEQEEENQRCQEIEGTVSWQAKTKKEKEKAFLSVEDPGANSLLSVYFPALLDARLSR